MRSGSAWPGGAPSSSSTPGGWDCWAKASGRGAVNAMQVSGSAARQSDNGPQGFSQNLEPGHIVRLALAGLVAAIGLVDDVGPAPAPHHAVVAMALAQSRERILDLHGKASIVAGGDLAPGDKRLSGAGRTIKSAASGVNEPLPIGCDQSGR